MECFDTIFTSEVISRLSATTDPSKNLERRILTITACGNSSHPSNHVQYGYARAQKAAWETYIEAASIVGLFDGESGYDLKERLISRDDDQFRGAISECMAAWFFGGKMALPVDPRPTGKGASQLEMLVHAKDLDFKVEVKSPYKELRGTMQWGNDSDVLVAVLETANKQFPKDSANVLFIAPHLRSSIAQDRYQLIQAFIGEEVIVVPIQMDDGKPFEKKDSYLDFNTNGRFIRPMKPDKSPGFTRVSAVVSCEENYIQGSLGCWVEHQIFVVHNPHAAIPISDSIFAKFIQFKKVDGGMQWSDFRRVGP